MIHKLSELSKKIDCLKNLNLQGMYSHLALADGSLSGHSAKVTDQQQDRFDSFLRF